MSILNLFRHRPRQQPQPKEPTVTTETPTPTSSEPAIEPTQAEPVPTSVRPRRPRRDLISQLWPLVMDETPDPARLTPYLLRAHDAEAGDAQAVLKLMKALNLSMADIKKPLAALAEYAAIRRSLSGSQLRQAEIREAQAEVAQALEDIRTGAKRGDHTDVNKLRARESRLRDAADTEMSECAAARNRANQIVVGEPLLASAGLHAIDAAADAINQAGGAL